MWLVFSLVCLLVRPSAYPPARSSVCFPVYLSICLPVVSPCADSVRCKEQHQAQSHTPVQYAQAQSISQIDDEMRMLMVSVGSVDSDDPNIGREQWVQVSEKYTRHQRWERE